MVNQATILGRVGKKDFKTTNTGMQICNLSMVTSKRITKNGQKEEKSTWHNITLFNKLAEIAEKYVNVGELLFIQGAMDSQKWADQSGVERTKHFIVANELKLMPRQKPLEPKPAAQEPAPGFESNAFVDSDIPF